MRISRALSTIILGVGVVSPMIFANAKTRAAETVFVMSNSADKNEVIAFSHSADGSVVEQNHYATGGRCSCGVNDPLDSQGWLTLSDDDSLLRLNAGSGDITVFRVNSNVGASRDDIQLSPPLKRARHHLQSIRHIHCNLRMSSVSHVQCRNERAAKLHTSTFSCRQVGVST